MSRIHPDARTTPKTRAESHTSAESRSVLAKRFNITKATVLKWKHRESMDDRSHRAHTLKTTLRPVEEAIAVELRRTLRLPWDDLLVIVREFLNAKVSRSGLDRCLRLHGVSNLNAWIPKAEGEKISPKTFRDYVPGYLHIDITYLPKMPNEAERSDLFVAIDRASRWVYFRIYPNPSQQSSADFLKN